MRTQRKGTVILVSLETEQIETCLRNFIVQNSKDYATGQFTIEKDMERSGIIPRFKLVPKPQEHWKHEQPAK